MTAHYTHTNEADLRAAMAAFPAIVTGAAETRVERAEAVEALQIPAEAETRAETRLDELARLLADTDADERPVRGFPARMGGASGIRGRGEELSGPTGRAAFPARMDGPRLPR